VTEDSREIPWRQAVSRQFGAAIDMLENAIGHCPERHWRAPAGEFEFWYLAYHTLFWLDLYLSGSVEEFAPPEPFTLGELDPAGVMPPRVYEKAEILEYLRHCREKSRATIADLTAQAESRLCTFSWGGCTFAELLLYNLRHVQHGAAQLNLVLRQTTRSAPGWVGRADLEV
jgi:hypothetical protein